MSTNEKYLSFAKEAALKSRDRSTQVGVIIITPDGTRVEGTNGIPLKCNNDIEYRHTRPIKYKYAEHAERDAIYTAAREGIALAESVMFLPWFPCSDCARAIIVSGIVKLVCYSPDLDHGTWGEDFKIAIELLEESGVEIVYENEI